MNMLHSGTTWKDIFIRAGIWGFFMFFAWATIYIIPFNLCIYWSAVTIAFIVSQIIGISVINKLHSNK